MDPECGFIASEPAHRGAPSDTTLLGEVLRPLQLWSLSGENYQIVGNPWEEGPERGGMVVWGWGAGRGSVSPEATSGKSYAVSDCKAHPETGLQLRSNANSINFKMLESYGTQAGAEMYARDKKRQREITRLASLVSHADPNPLKSCLPF